MVSKGRRADLQGSRREQPESPGDQHSALRGIASAPPKPALRQTLQQRLRLGDLWQFRCRGEAFEPGARTA